MLHRFIPDYPLQDDPNIQLEITKRKEFRDMEAMRKEVKGRSRFFNHQNLVFRYIKNYDRVFLFHETGTGKSGTIVNATEYFKKHPEEGIKRAVILEPGPATIKNFEEQILKHSEKGEYENEKTERATKIQTLKRNITAMLRKFYLIEGYETFTRQVRRLSDEDIKREFSDNFFFLDEIHAAIRNLNDNPGKDEKENKYEMLWKVLHIAERIKIIVGTATPLVNKTGDFVSMLNLILPENKQLPFSWDYSKVTYKQLEPFLRGKVTFLRASDTGINIERVGNFLDFKHKVSKPVNEMNGELTPVRKKIQDGKIISSKEPKQEIVKMKTQEIESQYKIKTVTMSAHQGKSFIDASKKAKKENDKKKKDAFLLQESYASLWVFPDGKYGEEGFKANIKVTEDEDFEMKPNFARFFENNEGEIDEKRGLETLRLCGCKIYFFINNELNNKGKSFCYLEFVRNTGTDLLGLLLEKFSIDGKFFKNFTGSSKSVFVKEAGSQKKKIRQTFKKHPRFAIFTSKTKNSDSILELFNSEENIDGDYLKIIIVSKTASVGINLDDVLRGYMLSPGWHEAGMHQAESRFLRATSHVRLLEKYGKADVKIYNLAAILQGENKATVKESSDIRKYISAERKDIEHQRLMNIMKKVSFDAFINYRRNFLPSDKDGGKEVGFEERLPTLPESEVDPDPKSRKLAYGQAPDEVVTTTDDIYYHEEEIEEAKRRIKDELRKKKNITIQEILSELNMRGFYILTAIDQLLTDRESVQDDYGTDLYIVQYGMNLYLTRNFPYTSLNRPPSNYSNMLILNETEEINYQGEQTEIDNQIEKIINEAKDQKMDLKQLKEYLIRNKVDPTILSALLEYAVLHREESEIYETIVKLFGIYIYKIRKPEKNIRLAEIELAKPKTGKVGREAAETSTACLKRIKYGEADGDHDVYIHFYPDTMDKTSFAINSIFTRPDKRIRIYDPTEKPREWRNPGIAENHVYNCMIDQYLNEFFGNYEKRGVFGTIILRDNKFRIRRPGDGGRGKACEFFSEDDIRMILKELLNKEDYENMMDKKKKKKEYCDVIMKLMDKQNRLIVTF